MTQLASEGAGADERAITPETEFFAAYGAAMMASMHVQYRLADLYAADFGDPRTGCLPRVQEKWHEAVNATLGGAFTLAQGSLTPLLCAEVRAAVDWRNYLAHHYLFDTRALQQEPVGLAALVGALMSAFGCFFDFQLRLRERYKEVLSKAGVPPSAFEENAVGWGDWDPPDAAPSPKKLERITRAYLGPARPGQVRIYLENEDGAFWQTTDVGLGIANTTPEERASWEVFVHFQRHLPAGVKSRPSAKSTPPTWRAPFNYDLWSSPAPRCDLSCRSTLAR